MLFCLAKLISCSENLPSEPINTLIDLFFISVLVKYFDRFYLFILYKKCSARKQNLFCGLHFFLFLVLLTLYTAGILTFALFDKNLKNTVLTSIKKVKLNEIKSMYNKTIKQTQELSKKIRGLEK